MAMYKIFFSYIYFCTILIRNVLSITINITFRTFIHEIVFHPREHQSGNGVVCELTASHI